MNATWQKNPTIGRSVYNSISPQELQNVSISLENPMFDLNPDQVNTNQNTGYNQGMREGRKVTIQEESTAALLQEEESTAALLQSKVSEVSEK